jgi:hypothetical protein
VRSFQTDFRTLYECIERVARGRGLRVECRGAGWQCEHEWRVRRLEERFALVVDPEKLRFAEGSVIHIDEVGRITDKRPLSQLRTIKLDPDTGGLSPPADIDLRGFEVTAVRFHFTLYNASNERMAYVEAQKRYADPKIRVEIDSPAPGDPALWRDLMEELQSKLRLAARLKEAREARRRKEKPGKPATAAKPEASSQNLLEIVR